MKNFERVKKMDIKELAKFVSHISDYSILDFVDTKECDNCNEEDCMKCTLKWLYMDEDGKCAEKVNHPSHYNRDGAMECIDEMVLLYGKEATANFCKLNAHKYRYRAGQKENGYEDLKKSDWYINKYSELTNTQCTIKPYKINDSCISKVVLDSNSITNTREAPISFLCNSPDDIVD